MTRIRIIGVPLDAQTLDEAVDTILGWRAERRCATAHFCNVHLAVTAHDRPEVRGDLEAGTMIATDGMPLVWLARRQVRRAERVAGPDVMVRVMDQGRVSGARHFLYGGAPGVPEELARRLAARLPGIEIVGTWSPPFADPTPDSWDADVARIEAASPDYVWVGLGAPKQEAWVESARSRLRVAGILAVGAAFDFHSGRRRRAPHWMQRAGLEWLFRLASEPGRLWRRYLVTNSRFAWLVVRSMVGRARGR